MIGDCDGAVESCDVAVVGGGGAGLAAAIEAAESGASVALLEKNPALGGSTLWSVGSITSSSTPYQRRLGIEDSPLCHWEDMPGFAGELDSRDNSALRRVMCEELPATFQWLMDSGIRFYGPMAEPPHRCKRMHSVLPNSRSYIYNLERRARRANVDIRTNAQVAGLIESDGAVVGLRYEHSGRVQRLESRTVILAAGDFSNSPQFKARFMGAQAAQIDGLNTTATGDGQRLGEALGGRVLNGDLALGPELRFRPPQHDNLIRKLPPWRPVALGIEWAMEHLPAALLRPFMMRFLTTALAPSPRLFEDGAILINGRGERFCDELHEPALQLPKQPNKSAHILIDGRIARLYSAWPRFISTAPGIAYAFLPDYRRTRPDVYTEAPHLQALAEKLNMDAARLTAVVAAYNDSLAPLECNGGEAAARRPLSSGPFIALGPVQAVFVHSEGGLAVDDQHRVLDCKDEPIQGLYAAGSSGQGGLLLKGHGHHLAWAFTSGRRAGRFAARAP
jgi:succinate dehydrogenase/fumarate reductase flavoprotein subunit